MGIFFLFDDTPKSLPSSNGSGLLSLTRTVGGFLVVISYASPDVSLAPRPLRALGAAHLGLGDGVQSPVHGLERRDQASNCSYRS